MKIQIIIEKYNFKNLQKNIRINSNMFTNMVY